MGAWIETLEQRWNRWERWVAPHMGAWIETTIAAIAAQNPEGSHPIWVRGLKPKNLREPLRLEVSHPIWVRGLKHVNLASNSLQEVRRTPYGCVD